MALMKHSSAGKAGIVVVGLVFLVAYAGRGNVVVQKITGTDNHLRALSNFHFHDPKTLIEKGNGMQRLNVVDGGEEGEVIAMPEKPNAYPDKVFRELIALTTEDPTSDQNPTLDLITNCNPTSQYLFVQGSGRESFLQSLDKFGKPKFVGGDELYVTYKDNSNDSISPTSVARIVDEENGRYALTFHQSHSPALQNVKRITGRGTITIYLSHTCGIGTLGPPMKAAWKNSGSVSWPDHPGDVVNAPFAEFYNRPMPHLEQPVPVQDFPFDFSKYQVVHMVGDSIMSGIMFKNKDCIRQGAACLRRSNVGSLGPRNPMTSLNTYSAETAFMKQIENAVQSHREHHIPDAQTALLLGSCAWDLATVNSLYSRHSRGFFTPEDHAAALAQLIKSVRTSYPRIAIYWRGCTAIHRHLVNCDHLERTGERNACEARMKYVSYTRSKQLDELQKTILAKLHVPVLDLLELSYEMAEYHYPGDALHYVPEWNDFIMDKYFYPQQPPPSALQQ